MRNFLFTLLALSSIALIPTAAFADVTESGPGSADDNVTVTTGDNDLDFIAGDDQSINKEGTIDVDVTDSLNDNSVNNSLNGNDFSDNSDNSDNSTTVGDVTVEDVANDKSTNDSYNDSSTNVTLGDVTVDLIGDDDESINKGGVVGDGSKVIGDDDESINVDISDSLNGSFNTDNSDNSFNADDSFNTDVTYVDASTTSDSFNTDISTVTITEGLTDFSFDASLSNEVVNTNTIINSNNSSGVGYGGSSINTNVLDN